MIFGHCLVIMAAERDRQRRRKTAYNQPKAQKYQQLQHNNEHDKIKRFRFESCIVHQHKTSEALGFQRFLFCPLTARQGLGVSCAPGPPMPHLTRRPLFCPISSARHSFPAPKKERPGVPTGTPGRFDICFSPAQNQAAAGFAGLSSGTGSRRGGDWAPRHRS